MVYGNQVVQPAKRFVLTPVFIRPIVGVRDTQQAIQAVQPREGTYLYAVFADSQGSEYVLVDRENPQSLRELARAANAKRQRTTQQIVLAFLNGDKLRFERFMATSRNMHDAYEALQ